MHVHHQMAVHDLYEISGTIVGYTETSGIFLRDFLLPRCLLHLPFLESVAASVTGTVSTILILMPVEPAM